MLPERLFDFEEDRLVLLGSRLLNPGYNHPHGPRRGCLSREGGAHQHRGHDVAGQVLLLVCPNTNHWKIPLNSQSSVILKNRIMCVKREFGQNAKIT